MFNASETFSDLELELMKIIWLWQCVRQYCNSWGTQRFKQFFYSLLKFWLEIWIRIFCKWETLFIFVQIRHLILSKLFDFKSGIVCLFYDMFEMAFFFFKKSYKRVTGFEQINVYNSLQDLFSHKKIKSRPYW